MWVSCYAGLICKRDVTIGGRENESNDQHQSCKIRSFKGTNDSKWTNYSIIGGEKWKYPEGKFGKLCPLSEWMTR